MVHLVSPFEITGHKTKEYTSLTAFVSSHSRGVYSGLAKRITFEYKYLFYYLEEFGISQMKFLSWTPGTMIKTKQYYIVICYNKNYRFLTDWGAENKIPHQKKKSSPRRGREVPRGGFKKNLPRKAKKFLALEWGIFFLPLDEEFLTFPWVKNLILPQLPVEESLIAEI